MKPEWPDETQGEILAQRLRTRCQQVRDGLDTLGIINPYLARTLAKLDAIALEIEMLPSEPVQSTYYRPFTPDFLKIQGLRSDNLRTGIPSAQSTTKRAGDQV